jgi:hypothetical protein
MPLLAQMRILSARSTFEDQFPGQPQLWKNAAFKQVFEETFESSKHAALKGPFNLISLGDSLYERSALKELTEAIDSALFKSLKLIEHPDIQMMQGQLSVLAGSVDELANSKKTIDTMLTFSAV